MTGLGAANDRGIVVLRDAGQVDLSRHAVIEASAGTGKTYMIEMIARRLVVEEGVPLSKILIVTYTEKATGELKRRLRERLENELKHKPGHARLREAIDAFDEAPISTIHGFCQRVLRQYAFENRQPMATELVKDEPEFERALREIQRRDWARQEPTAFAEFLKACGYPDQASNKSQWEKELLWLVGKWRPEAGDVLIPEVPEELEACIAQWREKCAGLMQAVLGLMKPSVEGFLDRYARTKEGRTKPDERLAHVFRPAVELLTRCAEGCGPRGMEWEAVIAVAEQHTFFTKERRGFLCLTDVVESESSWPELYRVTEKLIELDSALAKCSLLTVHTAYAVRRQAAIAKREKKQISYDDMVGQLKEAVDPERNSGAGELVEALRQRFRFALVDEFQDTDPAQWKIFKRIFVGSERQRLLVIGDPKQAIYSFRGADLHTYQKAVTDLGDEWGAQRYSLTTNWRSTPAVIGALNRFFVEGKWFEGDAPALDCPAVSPPIGAGIRTEVEADNSGRVAVSAVEVSGTGPAARRAYVLFIAAEVKRLLSDGAGIRIGVGGQATQALSASQICVLVDQNRDAEFVERVLRERGIPCTYYKKPGLWRSVAGLHILFLLRALAWPGDLAARRKALLTHFFRSGRDGDGLALAIRPVDLIDADVGVGHPASEALARWHGMAVKREWGVLFEDVLTTSGILLDEIRMGGGDRRIADYREIFDRLGEEAARDALDIGDLAARMAAHRNGDDEISGDEGLHVLEMEWPKVQILTSHKSKGLEYPVVFVVSRFSPRKNRGGAVVFHDERNGQKRTIDVEGKEENKEREEREQSAGTRRLLYVGMTRAMVKLYVPYCAEAKEGTEAKQIVDTWDKVFPENCGFSDAQRIVCDVSSARDLRPAKARKIEAGVVTLPEPGELMPVAEPVDRRRSVRVFSFSGLTRSSASRLHGPITLDEHRAEPAAEDEPEGSVVVAGAVALAGGVDAGNLLHGVLQRIEFAAVGAAEKSEELLAGATGKIISKAIDRYAAAVGGHRRVDRAAVSGACAELVFRALRTPLPWAGRLCDLKNGDYLREMDFHLYLPGLYGVEGIVARGDGYITGQIDLLCRAGGRYFIVDYKSNLLLDYGMESLDAKMSEHNYPLQRAIYAKAVSQWLGKDAAVAGALYLFVRGMGVGEAGIVRHSYESAAEIMKEFDRLALPRLAGELGDGER